MSQRSGFKSGSVHVIKYPGSISVLSLRISTIRRIRLRRNSKAQLILIED